MVQRSTRTEFATHIALLLVGAVISWIYWQTERPGPLKRMTDLRVDSSRVLAEWRPAAPRVLLFIDPACPFCVRSMPFYARLTQTVDSMRQAGVPVYSAVVIDASAFYQEQQQILQDAALEVDSLLQIAHLSFDRVGVPGVPTVAVLGADGAVRGLWVGFQPKAGEQEILSTVSTVGGP